MYLSFKLVFALLPARGSVCTLVRAFSFPAPFQVPLCEQGLLWPDGRDNRERFLARNSASNELRLSKHPRGEFQFVLQSISWKLV